jgi:hypothetical protein
VLEPGVSINLTRTVFLTLPPLTTASANDNETMAGDLLAPESAQPDGVLIGYAWLRPRGHDWDNCWISN